jgi:hypothetical protein
MYIITKTQTRKSIDIPFYFEKYASTDDYKNYFHKNYILTKKLISSSATYSDDKLLVTRIATWSSRRAFMEFAADRYCYETVTEPNREYDIQNDITSDIEIEGN